MRKILFIVCSLISVEIVFIVLTVSHFQILINNLDFYYNHAPQYYETLTEFYPNFVMHLIYAILAVLANLLNIATIIIIVIKEFPVFKPIVNKLNARKKAHEQAKAEQAAIAKQERIDKLQAELDELKKED